MCDGDGLDSPAPALDDVLTQDHGSESLPIIVIGQREAGDDPGIGNGIGYGLREGSIEEIPVFLSVDPSAILLALREAGLVDGPLADENRAGVTVEDDVVRVVALQAKPREVRTADDGWEDGTMG
jgi:hypothetical protein